MSPMEQHALAILEHSELWNRPDAKRAQTSGECWQAEKFRIIAPELLHLLIVESLQLGGEMLHCFWKRLETCNEKMEKNIARLQQENFMSAQRSLEILSQGLDDNLSFEPVFEMAVEFFTHLGVAFMSSGQQSGTSTESTDSAAFAISEPINNETDQLLWEVQEKGTVRKQKQELLKALVGIYSSQSHNIYLFKQCFKRDGEFCLLTGTQFVPFKQGHGAIHSKLCHVVPNSVLSKKDTLKCISIFAGPATAVDVINNLNAIGNVMNMECNAHGSYNQFKWSIQAKEEGGEVKYLFQLTPSSAETGIDDTCGPGYIALKEGDEILFGKGPEGNILHKGPIASLCNLRLAVARAFITSGTADLIERWKDEADNMGYASGFIRSEDDCQLLDTKLLLPVT